MPLAAYSMLKQSDNLSKIKRLVIAKVPTLYFPKKVKCNGMSSV